MKKRLFLIPLCLLLLAACSNNKEDSSSSSSQATSSSSQTSQTSQSSQSSSDDIDDLDDDTSSSSSEASSSETSSGETSSSEQSSGSESSSAGSSSQGELRHEALPVLPSGGTLGATRVEGAGIIIHLDNSILNINGAISESIVKASTVEVAVSKTEDTPDGFDGVVQGMEVAEFMFNDYSEELHTVCLYIRMNMGSDPTWKFKYEVNASVVIENTAYEGSLTFIGGEYQA